MHAAAAPSIPTYERQVFATFYPSPPPLTPCTVSFCIKTGGAGGKNERSKFGPFPFVALGEDPCQIRLWDLGFGSSLPVYGMRRVGERGSDVQFCFCPVCKDKCSMAHEGCHSGYEGRFGLVSSSCTGSHVWHRARDRGGHKDCDTVKLCCMVNTSIG